MNKIKLSLEPLVRIINSLMSLNAWSYKLMVSGGAYYLVVVHRSAEVAYRISEMTDLGADVLVCILPNEFIALLSGLGIKVASKLTLELELTEDVVKVSVENYENTFECEYEDWKGFLPEDLLEREVGTIGDFSKVMNLFKFSAVESIVLEDNKAFGLEANLDAVHVTEVSLPSNIHFWIRFPKFMYSTLSKMRLENDSVIFYKSYFGDTFFGTFKLKLTSREQVHVQIFYIREPVLFHDDIFDPLKILYERMLEAPIVTITADKIQKQHQYVIQKELDDDSLVMFAGNRKIRVKDFVRYFAKQREVLTEVRLLDNMVLVDASVQTLLTLYERVESNGCNTSTEDS